MSEAISSTTYKDASCLALLVICILRVVFFFDIISPAASGKPVSKEFTLYLFFITGMSSTSLLVVLNELSRIDGFSLYRSISTAWLAFLLLTILFVSVWTNLLVNIVGEQKSVGIDTSLPPEVLVYRARFYIVFLVAGLYWVVLKIFITGFL